MTKPTPFLLLNVRPEQDCEDEKRRRREAPCQNHVCDFVQDPSDDTEALCNLGQSPEYLLEFPDGVFHSLADDCEDERSEAGVAMGLGYAYVDALFPSGFKGFKSGLERGKSISTFGYAKIARCERLRCREAPIPGQ